MEDAAARYALARLGKDDWRLYDHQEQNVVRTAGGGVLSYETREAAQRCADLMNGYHERRVALLNS